MRPHFIEILTGKARSREGAGRVGPTCDAWGARRTRSGGVRHVAAKERGK